MNSHASAEWRPIAHISVADTTCRAAVIDALHQQRWSVVEHPTGLHLIHAISGIILGDQPSLRPGLIMADAAARGCSGLSIARGMLDLGSRIPVVVVANAVDELATGRDGPLTIVRPENAPRVAELLARRPGGRPGIPSAQYSATA